MKKSIIVITALLITGLCACRANEEIIRQSNENVADRAEQNTEVAQEPYSMMLYTEAPNPNSSIKIEYPYFSGNNFDSVNELVYDKVQNLAQIDTSFFPGDAGLTLDYKSAVTLLNNKAVSIIFWGLRSIEGGAYPTDNLITLNIDLESMEEITFEDLYAVDGDFINIFFERAFFPVNPVTSCDEVSFEEMLKLQTPEYQSADPFSISGNVSCFLKPDGIVLSMPAVHATGNDHFEAQLKYNDIQQFYLPQKKYWEGESDKSDMHEKAFMMLGNIGDLGMGHLVCTLPIQKNEDYRLYFFSSEKYTESEKAEDYDLEAANYIFPDVRENNEPTGAFIEIYYLDLADLTQDDIPELLVIAKYDVDGRVCYDTRIYESDGTGFAVNDELTQKMNQKYRDVDDYPIAEIMDLPHD